MLCLSEDEEPRLREGRRVTDPRAVGCTSFRELMRINAPSTDVRFKWYRNAIPRALLTVPRAYGVSYIRECMRVNKIFLDGEKGRDLCMNKATARRGFCVHHVEREYRDSGMGSDGETRRRLRRC